MKARSEIELLIRHGRGLISRREHPSLANTLAWLVRQGKLVPVLPGVYAPPETAGDVEVLIRAVSLRHPDAVVLGAAAARVSFWPEAPIRAIEVAAPTRLASQPGYTFSRRHIPPELVVERTDLRFTAPALTAIDLATFECADALDIALRTRAATLSGMYEAFRLTPNRTGNQQRLKLLIDSGTNPGQPPSVSLTEFSERQGSQVGRRTFPCSFRTASITSTSPSGTSNSQLRLMADCTKRMRIFSNRTDGGRTLWLRTVGWYCASPGGCSENTLTPS